ncbi:hypothetical protein [Nocardia sp. NBC_00416]|uniref:hypothetical protein n=1 Tax=Nocardia sp. NBC_00416 TaxID=2975991 RepID=UPI002E21A672
MVLPFGSALERRSRTTYRPTVAPEGSTHVDTAFTGTTSSFSRTVPGKVAVVAGVRQQVFEVAADRPPHLRRIIADIAAGAADAISEGWTRYPIKRSTPVDSRIR